MSRTLWILATSAVLLIPGSLAAQTTGQIVGRIESARDSTPIPDAQVLVVAPGGDSIAGVTTGRSGEFVLIGLAPGVYTLTVRRVGYRTADVRGIVVRSGSSARVGVALAPLTVDLPAIPVVVEERPLLTPDVSASRQVVGRDALENAPVQDIAQILELRTGVSDGHFRGGRVGQETYVIDGVEVKDQFAASRNGIAFQLAPSAVQEVSVFTSGFSADQPSAVSGVVNLVSRSGPRDRWFGRVELVSDEWAPSSLKRGYDRVGGTAGGPLGGGATAFLDLALIGAADLDPRVGGLACLPGFPCPAARAIIPHHEGDRYFAFGRIDVPLGTDFAATLSVSRNRDQHELYSTRFKYELPGYLGEREIATLGTAQLSGTFRLSSARAIRLTSRLSLARIDRYLGVPDTLQPARLGRFQLGNLRFRGEDFVRQNVVTQVETGRTVPGYVQPSDSGLASPYGILGADLFVTDGTSGIAEWTRSDFGDLRVDLQSLVSPQHDLKVGADFKFYRIAAYQHVSAALAGAAPNFVRFYPRTVAAYVHNTLYALDAATIDLGVRLEAFQPRLTAPTDRRDLTAPTETTAWQVILHPRVGFAMPLSVVGVDRAAIRWNFGRFAQPPDFQFFFDQALDDSLNTAVRRQGNPNLGFERATQYELGLDYLLANDVLLRVTGYLKDLSGLTTSGIAIARTGEIFTNLDFGRVQGLEVTFEARLDPDRRFQLGYVLQKAVGVVSSAYDSLRGTEGERLELPLQFDRRHALDLNLYWRVPLGIHISVGGSAGSGLPVPGAAERRLPWTVALAARLSRTWSWGSRRVRLLVEGRNLLNRANLVTARLGGGVTPDVAALEAEAARETANATPIPRESPLYLPAFDADGNGYLDPSEQTAARRAALLDFNEPTLLYGEARQIRLGIEIGF